MHFEKFAVLWTYFQYKGSIPTPDQLAEWDRTLKLDYDNILVEKLIEYQLPVDKETKSRVLMLARIAKASVIKAQVRLACEYYAGTWPEEA